MATSLVTIAFAVVSCGDANAPTNVGEQRPVPRDGASYWPGADWRRAEPAQVGLDGAVISSVVQRLQSGAVAGVNALVIIRQGYLVTEQYFNGSRRDDVHTMQSVTKSVTALVAAMAMDAGALAADARIFDLLPEYSDIAEATPGKRAITVTHLLRMRSGIDFYESPYAGSPLQRLNDSRDDWVRIALEPPMNAPAGERWQYNSGGVIVVAAAVQRVLGVPFAEAARQRLFEPLGIDAVTWVRSPFNGLPHAGGGLSLRAIDLARIGYLVLRQGRWNDRRLVSEQALAEMTRPFTQRFTQLGGYVVDYGQLWWLYPIDPTRPTDAGNVVYAASGNLNQWLFVVPHLDLVMVMTGQSNTHFGAPVQILMRDILPAVRDN